MARVVIFDSGVGGLSIHQELVRKRPDLEYVFVSDNAAFPYGIKQDEELLERVEQVVAAIVDQCNPDLIVIACNTASTVALETLRARFPIPIVGVVPAIKPAARITKTGKISVLGTPATARRSYTQKLVDEFASDCEVRLMGSSVMVELAEQKLRGMEIDLSQLALELKQVCDFEACDTLVLACTHFPLINNEIRFFLKQNPDIEIEHIVDSGEAIARRVDNLLPGVRKHKVDSDMAGAWFTRELVAGGSLVSALENRHLPMRGVLKL